MPKLSKTTKVFNISSFCNNDVLNSIAQKKIRHELDDIPDNGEIAEAIFQAKHDRACGDSGIAAEFWQALDDCDSPTKEEKKRLLLSSHYN